MSDKEDSYSRSRSDSRRRSRDRSRSRSRSRRRHHSRSRSRGRRYSRSRSRSYSRGGGYSRSRSRSYDRRRSSRYDRNDRSGYYRSRSRSPMSSRRRHLGDRERPQTSRCLGVFGLSLYTQERDLRDIFERFGPIDDLQIVYDHQTGRSRGFAFIYYRNLDDAVEAKEMAPGTEIDGRRIRVDYSITERAHTPTPGVYLGRPTASGFRSTRRSRSPFGKRRSSRSYSRSPSYSPRRY